MLTQVQCKRKAINFHRGVLGFEKGGRFTVQTQHPQTRTGGRRKKEAKRATSTIKEILRFTVSTLRSVSEGMRVSRLRRILVSTISRSGGRSFLSLLLSKAMKEKSH